MKIFDINDINDYSNGYHFPVNVNNEEIIQRLLSSCSMVSDLKGTLFYSVLLNIELEISRDDITPSMKMNILDKLVYNYIHESKKLFKDEIIKEYKNNKLNTESIEL